MTAALDAMVKAMAMAMARHDAIEIEGRYDEQSWPHMSDAYRDKYLARAKVAARAGLAAIREPTSDVLGAGIDRAGDTEGRSTSYAMAETFTAMVDNILGDRP